MKCLHQNYEFSKPSVADRLLQKLCNAAQASTGDFDKQILFNPSDVLAYFTKEMFSSKPVFLFKFWPQSVRNPFVPILCIYGSYQFEECAYNSPEFLKTAQTLCAQTDPPTPILHSALLLAKNSSERVSAARRLVNAGLDPNSITHNSLLFGCPLMKGCRTSLVFYMEEITPLAVAVSFADFNLLHCLIKLGANPCLVCIHLIISLLASLDRQVHHFSFILKFLHSLRNSLRSIRIS